MQADGKLTKKLAGGILVIVLLARNNGCSCVGKCCSEKQPVSNRFDSDQSQRRQAGD